MTTSNAIVEYRETIVAEVIRLMIGGMTITEALEQLQIPRRTFYNWQAIHPEAFQLLNTTRKEILQSNIQRLHVAYEDVLNKLLVQAERSDLGLYDLMSLENKLAHKITEIESILGANSKQDSEAKRFIGGIEMKPGKTRVTRVTETVDFDIHEPPEVIDGEVSDPD